MTGDWLSHVTDFWLTYGTGNHPNVLFIAYEELIADSAAMIDTIARFLGKQFTAETVANITTHCSLKIMRDNPMANRSKLVTRYSKPGAQFVRKGIIGDWRAHMTNSQSAQFDERFGQPLRAIGLRVCDDVLTAERCMQTTGRIINNV
ncbi:unnamed protein product [Medioppia subpectinata]|uniref:Sulfotransferase domain-containing protein n=1 Tax=Medioppia subpectinata TaxID=1979941 RepID=A0A7R9KP82_9ACAR|nr:unnamed protein product [Medioppia subpectinata]CAG2105851.1 unnamed protein product [Medioppia subpectinata]